MKSFEHILYDGRIVSRCLKIDERNTVVLGLGKQDSLDKRKDACHNGTGISKHPSDIEDSGTGGNQHG